MADIIKAVLESAVYQTENGTNMNFKHKESKYNLTSCCGRFQINNLNHTS